MIAIFLEGLHNTATMTNPNFPSKEPNNEPPQPNEISLDLFRAGFKLRLKPGDLGASGQARLRYLPHGRTDVAMEESARFSKNGTAANPGGFVDTKLIITTSVHHLIESKLDAYGTLTADAVIRRGYLIRDEDAQNVELTDPPLEGTAREMADETLST